MTGRPHIVALPAAIAAERASARVKHVAALLDCDESQVRRLIESGELEAHRIGKRGVRVYMDSVDTYRERRAIIAVGAPTRYRKPLISKATRLATAAAMADLRADGIV
jgi:excisionase family DNA binding protein